MLLRKNFFLNKHSFFNIINTLFLETKGGSLKTYTYIDNSNLFIEGRRVSAVRRGLVSNLQEAFDRKIVDWKWELDYGELYLFLQPKIAAQRGCVKLWGSVPPSDSFWDMVKREGFEHKVFDRGPSGEKKVDVAIAHAMTKDAYTIIDKTQDEIILVAGDKDFVPVLEDLRSNGFRTKVVFWAHAANELKQLASQYINLNSHVSRLGRIKT